LNTIHERHSSIRRIVSSIDNPVRGVRAGSRLTGTSPALYSTRSSGSVRASSISRGSANSG
jgi:hypothetical protein